MLAYGSAYLDALRRMLFEVQRVSYSCMDLKTADHASRRCRCMLMMLCFQSMLRSPHLHRVGRCCCCCLALGLFLQLLLLLQAGQPIHTKQQQQQQQGNSVQLSHQALQQPKILKLHNTS
jgi:hypothetical protein